MTGPLTSPCAVPLLAWHTAQLQASIWPTLDNTEGVVMGGAVGGAHLEVGVGVVDVVLLVPLFAVPLAGVYEVGVV